MFISSTKFIRCSLLRQQIMIHYIEDFSILSFLAFYLTWNQKFWATMSKYQIFLTCRMWTVTRRTTSPTSWSQSQQQQQWDVKGSDLTMICNSGMGIGFEFTEIRVHLHKRDPKWFEIRLKKQTHASLILNSLQWTCLKTIHNNAMMKVSQAPCSNRLYYLESSCHILDSKTSGLLDSAI